MTLQPTILLGFDFGLKRIGVAVAQTVTQTARGIGVLKALNGVPNWDQLAVFIKKWQPDALVVGIPVNMDGSDQPITKAAKRFAVHLQEKCKLKVYGEDERLTTVDARETIYQMGGYRALQKNSVDSIAAEFILKNWLAAHCN